KLWNSARFRYMQNIPGKIIKLSELKAEELSNDEKWIIGRLSEISEKINDFLENFKFHDASHLLYDFVRGEFCDWFIECQKLRFNVPEYKESAIKVFDFIFYSILRLLHPFMPFITEEIAHQIKYLDESQSIMLSDFPEAISAEELKRLQIDSRIIQANSVKFSIISAARKLKVDAKLAPNQKVKFYFNTTEEDISIFLNNEIEMLKKFTFAEDFIIGGEFPANPGISTQLSTGTLFLSLEGIIDLKAEIEKLEKQKLEFEKWLTGARAKIANEKFLSKAPPQLVENTKNQITAIEEKLKAINENIAYLSNFSSQTQS
ncbi:MAG TPA: class I tRNA ligase family protein, partial [Victivallales bacterium]|nr:class I tRNA ligase family protein [Victivallales bacterium]